MTKIGCLEGRWGSSLEKIRFLGSIYGLFFPSCQIIILLYREKKSDERIW